MKINSNLTMFRCNEGNYISISGSEGRTRVYYSDRKDLYERVSSIYDTLLSVSPAERETKFPTEIEEILNTLMADLGGKAEPHTIPADPKKVLTKALGNMIKFFSEFQFEPNFRFVNSFALALQKSPIEGKTYIRQYFELIDSPYTKEINQKIDSAEFEGILSDMVTLAPTHTVNNRFKLYYGSQGTGKTTLAMKETDGRCMVCNSSMLPADIMEDFTFVDGKATFKPSSLWNCMTEGKAIVMDEINLLPFDTLRFLQTILDGKREFLYKGHTVTIADGFCIIGTMNLCVNGMVYGLPEPLIDRCKETRKFTLSAEDLVSAILD